MNVRAGFVLVLALTFSLPALASDTYVDGMVILQFKPAHMPAEAHVSLLGPVPHLGIDSVDHALLSHRCSRIEKVLRTYGHERSVAGRLLERTYVVYYSDGISPVQLSNELMATGIFESARPNRRLERIYGGTVRYYPSEVGNAGQWNLDNAADSIDIDAPEAWAIERGDPNVIIGIIDSGVMVDASQFGLTGEYRLHGDLSFYFNPYEDQGQIGSLGYDDLDDHDGADPDDDLPLEYRVDNVIGHTFPEPDSSLDSLTQKVWRAVPQDWVHGRTWSTMAHGTAVASIAASVANGFYTVGVANQCKIYALRDGSERTSVVTETYAIDMAADFSSVINMSWEYAEDPSDPMFTAALERASGPKESGGLDCVLVSIAGNISKGITNGVAYPGRYDNVLAVGNVGPDLQLYDSASGPSVGDVSMVAPVGTGIPAAQYTATSTTFPFSFSESVTASFGGTSAAAPQVAGIAALIRSRFPNLNQEQVRRRLVRSCEWHWGTTTADTVKYGAGKVNAYRALTEWGSLESTTAWSATDTRDGKYYVSGDLTVEPGDTLTINPGVVVKVAPDNEHSGADVNRVKIVVRGTLNIIGTVAEPVVFESFTDSPPTSSDWVGIEFETGSSGSISHVVIKNAQQAILSFAPLTVDDVTITDAIGGIQNYDDLTIANSVFHDLNSNAIDVVHGNLDCANVEVYNCNFGINLTPGGDGSTGGYVKCEDSHFHDMTFGLDLYYPTDSVVVAKTTIEDVSDGAVIGHQTYALVDSCTIRRANRGVWALDSTAVSIDHSVVEACTTNAVEARPYSHVTIANSTLRGSDIGLLADHCEDVSVASCTIDSMVTTGVYVEGAGSASIKTNTISDNLIGVYCYKSSPEIRRRNVIENNVTGIRCDSSFAAVESCTVAQNTYDVMAWTSANPDLGHTVGGNSVGYNIFTPVTSYYVYNRTSNTISAEHDYWPANPPTICTPGPTKLYGPVDADPGLCTEPGLGGSSFMAVLGGGEDAPPSLPKRFGLRQNYPNPFNPATTISYDLPRPGGRVELTIYDAAGRLVKVLLDEASPPGRYTIHWDGRDRHGRSVASGVYFLRMTSGHFDATRKIVLLR